MRKKNNSKGGAARILSRVPVRTAPIRQLPKTFFSQPQKSFIQTQARPRRLNNFHRFIKPKTHNFSKKPKIELKKFGEEFTNKLGEKVVDNSIKNIINDRNRLYDPMTLYKLYQKYKKPKTQKAVPRSVHSNEYSVDEMIEAMSKYKINPEVSVHYNTSNINLSERRSGRNLSKRSSGRNSSKRSSGRNSSKRRSRRE